MSLRMGHAEQHAPMHATPRCRAQVRGPGAVHRTGAVVPYAHAQCMLLDARSGSSAIGSWFAVYSPCPACLALRRELNALRRLLWSDITLTWTWT